MCGIVGFTNDISNSEEILDKMMDRIKHRGPDAEGKYINNDIALGHRRLSIIDVGSQGNQPIFNEDESMVIVFNGEIYNYSELRKELENSGHVFRTNTDTEVVLHGYEEFQHNILLKLRGMFAFIIWDNKKKELFGARDIFGIKPLYYSKMKKSFMFGSEIKSFLEHPDFKKELNTDVLESYLTFQYSPTEETFFKNVYKLPPAHFFILKKENEKTDNMIQSSENLLNIVSYWNPHFKVNNSLSLEEWVDKISDVFHDSVNAHKVADVEVGSFLSSGVDSSYVAAIADVDKTFTVGFGKDEKYNEIGWAKNFATAIGKENISKIILPEEYWNSLSKIQYHMDEPLADPSAVALYFVCNLASENLKVVLSGEGADEIFGGYNVYSEPNGTLYDKLPRSIKRTIADVAEHLPAKKGVNFLVRKGRDIEERFIGNAYMFTPKERKKLLKIKTNAPDPAEITSKYFASVRKKDDVTKMQYLDLKMWLVGDILLKADKMSMANSLEVRVPFLDRKVIKLAEKIPTKYRVTHDKGTSETKYITKYAMRLSAKKDIPPQTESTSTKKKLGFPVPIRVWLREEKYYNIVKKSFESKVSEEFFDKKMLMDLLNNHKEGKADNSRKIWTVFTFLVWYDVYFNKNGQY